jgi:hypothetical protein
VIKWLSGQIHAWMDLIGMFCNKCFWMMKNNYGKNRGEDNVLFFSLFLIDI